MVRVVLVVALAMMACGRSAAPALEPAQGLLLPGMKAVVPAGEVTTAVMHVSREGVLRVAAVVLENVKTGNRARLVVAKRDAKGKMTLELERNSTASDFLKLDLGPFGPAGHAAVAVQWASGPEPHEGLLEVWALDSAKPAAALQLHVEGFYFEDVDGDGTQKLVVYRPETESLVFLPSVYEWKDGRLAESKARHDRLEMRLLAEYDEVLTGYEAEGAEGDPPRLVMDVALQKGRVLERRGELKAAFEAYERAVNLVPGGLLVQDAGFEEREEILKRAAEARKRAVDIYRGKAK